MSRGGTFLLGLALGLLLATAYHLLAAGTSRRGSPPIQDLLQAHQDALQLDAATLEQSWAIADAAKPELDGYHASLRDEREALRGLLEQASVDPVAMAGQVARIGELETRLRTRELETMLAIRALLAPDQVQALRDLATPSAARR